MWDKIREADRMDEPDLQKPRYAFSAAGSVNYFEAGHLSSAISFFWFNQKFCASTMEAQHTMLNRLLSSFYAQNFRLNPLRTVPYLRPINSYVSRSGVCCRILIGDSGQRSAGITSRYTSIDYSYRL